MKRFRFVIVGGLLGAGKTTTLARLARFYTTRGQKVGLVTNDQAEGLVDTTSLRAGPTSSSPSPWAVAPIWWRPWCSP
jgi:G3E family GTPase